MSQDINITKAGDFRAFIQTEDNPSASLDFYGCLQIDGLSQDQGETTPIYCPSTTERNRWDIVDEFEAAPALPTWDFTQQADRYSRDAWWTIKETGCRFNAFVTIASCGRPDDPDVWDSAYLLTHNKMTTFTPPATMNPLEGDGNAVAQLTGSNTARDMERILQLLFEEQADTTVVAEVVDGTYYDAIQCGACGEQSDGCRKEYWLTAANSGSPGLSSQIVYSEDNEATWATDDINTLGGLSGSRMTIVRNYVVVVSVASGSHHYKLISNLGTAGGWTEVAGGYATGPRCIYSKSSTQTFVGGQGGYIYLMSNPTQAVTTLTDGSVTTQHVLDIDGDRSTVVGVCESNAILYSQNSGETFTLVTGPEVGQNLTTIWVRDNNMWIVGTGNGNLYYTLNSGTTWTQIVIDSDIAVINDIKFAENGVVGYLAAQTLTAGRVYRTVDVGNSWHRIAPYIAGLPANERINVVAPCHSNRVGAGGRQSVGGDGLIATAQ